MKANVWSFLGFTALSFLVACSDFKTSEKAQSQAENTVLEALKIDPPFEGIEIPFSHNVVNGKTGGEIRLENNSSINVPAEAFVDKAGNVVQGDVVLKYREFQSIEDVMISGIPMTFRGEDGVENMVTAGMFEIMGEANGQEVFIAPDKKLEMNTVSYTTHPGVKFFELDSKSKQWKYVDESTTKPLEKVAQLESNDDLQKRWEKPSMPNKADQDAFKFDIAVDYSKFPELKKHKGVIWQYVSTDGFDNPEKDNHFYSEKWVGIDLKSFDKAKKQYELVLTSNSRTFHSVVTPVLGERNFKKAQARYEKELGEYMASVNAVSAANRQQAEITRQMSISNFGTYNHDYFYKATNPVVSNLELKLNGIEAAETDQLSAFLVMKSKNAVIRYSQGGYDNFSNFTFDQKENNALVVVLPKKKIAVFSPEQFRKATANGKNCVFEITNTTAIANLKDMSEVIKSL